MDRIETSLPRPRAWRLAVLVLSLTTTGCGLLGNGLVGGVCPPYLTPRVAPTVAPRPAAPAAVPVATPAATTPTRVDLPALNRAAATGASAGATVGAATLLGMTPVFGPAAALGSLTAATVVGNAALPFGGTDTSVLLGASTPSSGQGGFVDAGGAPAGDSL